VRRIWVAKDEQWYFSVVDAVEILTESVKPRDYWYRLNERTQQDSGFQLSTTEIIIQSNHV